MAYFNFKYAKDKDLTPIDVLTLQIIKQLRIEPYVVDDLAMILTDEFTDRFESSGHIKTIKGKKSDSELSKLRLTKKGNNLLSNLETPEIDEDSLKIFEWLKSIYTEKETGILGNQKRTKMGIALFTKETGINRNSLAILIREFIDSDSFEYSHKLENLFFNNKGNPYSTRFKIEECRLYQFYLKKKYYFEKLFGKLENGKL